MRKRSHVMPFGWSGCKVGFLINHYLLTYQFSDCFHRQMERKILCLFVRDNCVSSVFNIYNIHWLGFSSEWLENKNKLTSHLIFLTKWKLFIVLFIINGWKIIWEFFESKWGSKKALGLCSIFFPFQTKNNRAFYLIHVNIKKLWLFSSFHQWKIEIFNYKSLNHVDRELLTFLLYSQ